MSKAEDLRYQLERQRRQAMFEARVRETTARYLERYAALLADVESQDLARYVPEEMREAQRLLARAQGLLGTDPAAARALSMELGGRVHGLPALARAASRAARDAEIRAEAEREVREQAALQGLEQLWRTELAAWDDALARQLARPVLAQLRRSLMQGPRTASPGEFQSALARVRAEAQARADTVRQAARQEAEADAARQLREQIRSAGAVPDGATASALARQLAQVVERADEQAVDEDVRREVVKAVNQALVDAGFVVERPRRYREGDTDEVVLRAARPSGAEATFRVDLNGAMHYEFDRYEGTACRKDVERVLPSLQSVYGIHLSDRRVIWENPDDRDQDARPRPDSARRNTHG